MFGEPRAMQMQSPSSVHLRQQSANWHRCATLADGAWLVIPRATLIPVILPLLQPSAGQKAPCHLYRQLRQAPPERGIPTHKLEQSLPPQPQFAGELQIRRMMRLLGSWALAIFSLPGSTWPQWPVPWLCRASPSAQSMGHWGRHRIWKFEKYIENLPRSVHQPGT